VHGDFQNGDAQRLGDHQELHVENPCGKMERWEDLASGGPVEQLRIFAMSQSDSKRRRPRQTHLEAALRVSNVTNP
jgi:hypothetical protein